MAKSAIFAAAVAALAFASPALSQDLFFPRPSMKDQRCTVLGVSNGSSLQIGKSVITVGGTCDSKLTGPFVVGKVTGPNRITVNGRTLCATANGGKVSLGSCNIKQAGG
jgi:hypothetical protein